MAEGEFITAGEAAELLGISDHAVRARLRVKTLTGKHLRGRHLVCRDALFETQVLLSKQIPQGRRRGRRPSHTQSGDAEMLLSLKADIHDLRTEIGRLSKLLEDFTGEHDG